MTRPYQARVISSDATAASASATTSVRRYTASRLPTDIECGRSVPISGNQRCDSARLGAAVPAPSPFGVPSAYGVPSGSTSSVARSATGHRRVVPRDADVPNVLGSCTCKIDRSSPLERTRPCNAACPRSSPFVRNGICTTCDLAMWCFSPDERWCAHTSVNLTNNLSSAC